MRMHRTAAAMLLCAALLPAAVSAQQTGAPRDRTSVTVVPATGGGMLGVMTEAIRTGNEPSRQRVIRDVVPESPAQRAGLVAGDTIVRINGLAATEQVMGSPFEPGDTVVLRVRRNGAERDVTVVAAPRSGMTYRTLIATPDHALPDSVMQQISVIMSNVRSNVENLRELPLSIERMAGDSNVIMRFGSDSVRIFRYDNLRDANMPRDSVIARFRNVRPGEFPMIFSDSARVQFYNSRIGSLGADTIEFVRPSDIVTSNVFFGMRSIAGAEVSELNPGLAEYFGVGEGLLVLDAREGTPAARAGIQAGDVIVQVNGVRATSLVEVRRTMLAAATGSSMQIRVLRRGQPIDLTLGR
jgi:membrane-associated protease RseP (regulator of RpoE activity)